MADWGRACGRAAGTRDSDGIALDRHGFRLRLIPLARQDGQRDHGNAQQRHRQQDDVDPQTTQPQHAEVDAHNGTINTITPCAQRPSTMTSMRSNTINRMISRRTNDTNIGMISARDNESYNTSMSSRTNESFNTRGRCAERPHRRGDRETPTLVGITGGFAPRRQGDCCWLRKSDLLSAAWGRNIILTVLDLRLSLGRLARTRPIFHSEADFQHALAWEIREQHPEAEIRLEFRPRELRERAGTSILWVSSPTFTAAIELRYKTARLAVEASGERFELLPQGAHYYGRFDMLKDVYRLEQVVSAYENATATSCSSRMTAATGDRQPEPRCTMRRSISTRGGTCPVSCSGPRARAPALAIASRAFRRRAVMSVNGLTVRGRSADPAGLFRYLLMPVVPQRVEPRQEHPRLVSQNSMGARPQDFRRSRLPAEGRRSGSRAERRGDRPASQRFSAVLCVPSDLRQERVGAFHDPRRVSASTSTPPRTRRSG